MKRQHRYLAPLLFFIFLSPALSQADSCRHTFSADEYQALLFHSTPDNVQTFSDALPHIREIEELFTRYGDHRGVFAIFYRNILETAVPEIEQGNFKFNGWSEEVSRQFVLRYMDNLHRHLLGQPVTESWHNFYLISGDCSRSVGRAAAAALTAHLTLDFPEAINDANSYFFHFNDFYAIGQLLTDVTLSLVDDIENVYGVDLTDFFNLYFFGEAIDQQYGDGVSSEILFQSVRITSWSHGLSLRARWIDNGKTRQAMRNLWLFEEHNLDILESLNKL